MGSGYCKDCRKWGPEGSRERAQVGLCPEYSEMTSFETSCNKRFEPIEQLTGPLNCKNPACPFDKHVESATDYCCMACRGMHERADNTEVRDED